MRGNSRRPCMRNTTLTVLTLLMLKVYFDLHQSIPYQEAIEPDYVASLFSSPMYLADNTLPTTLGSTEAISSKNHGTAGSTLNSTFSTSSKYAYAFVIGGVDPEHNGYRGFVYNVLVVAKLMKEFGSKADVVVFIQMSSKSPATALPEDEARVLGSLGVLIQYIDKSEYESFYDTAMSKFRILGLVQYRRVLFLDGDVMPIGNLDYLFELSDGDNEDSLLKENVVVSGIHEPANGGFFMLEPGEGRHEQVDEVIRRREAKAEEDKDGHGFDVVMGWGHKIDPPDEWVTRFKRGRKWNFHGAFVDQGLLYYYTKYLRKSVSIIHRDKVENWAANATGDVYKEDSFDRPFLRYNHPVLRDREACSRFMCDFVHFTGPAKPWMSKDGPPLGLTNDTKLSSAVNLWWWTLMEVSTEGSMGLNFTHWRPPASPPLGLFASQSDLHARSSASIL